MAPGTSQGGHRDGGLGGIIQGPRERNVETGSSHLAAKIRVVRAEGEARHFGTFWRGET